MPCGARDPRAAAWPSASAPQRRPRAADEGARRARALRSRLTRRALARALSCRRRFAWTGCPPVTSRALVAAVAGLAPRARAPVVAGSVAGTRWAVSARWTIGARTRGECGHDRLERLLRSEQLEPLGLRAMTAIDDDAQDRDAFEVDVGFDLDDVADLRVRREQAALDHTARLASARRAPRPGAVRARAGELDLHPARHREANLVVVVATSVRGPQLLPHYCFVTVTKQPDTRRCRWCGRPFAFAAGPGRPPLYCRRSCRQRDYEARRRGHELGLAESDVVIARRELERLGDLVYVLRCAIDDVERDLEWPDGKASVKELREAVAWLLDAARPLSAFRPE